MSNPLINLVRMQHPLQNLVQDPRQRQCKGSLPCALGLQDPLNHMVRLHDPVIPPMRSSITRRRIYSISPRNRLCTRLRMESLCLLNSLVMVTMLDTPSAMPNDSHVELHGADHTLFNRCVTPHDQHCSLRGLVDCLLNHQGTRQIMISLNSAY